MKHIPESTQGVTMELFAKTSGSFLSFFFGDLGVNFYLGQNEDCSLGGGTSDSSERLLQKGSQVKTSSSFKVLLHTYFQVYKRPADHKDVVRQQFGIH